MPQSKLLTLPLRVSATAAKLTLTVTVQAVKLAAGAAGLGASRSAPAPSRTTAASRGPVVRTEPTPPTAPPPAAAPVPDPDTTPRTPLRATDAAAKTIDDTDEVIAEFSEPGGEDGAGAALRIDAPWEGYDSQNAATVIERIGALDVAGLAIVELYEGSHKSRQTVLAAAGKRLKTLSPPG